MRLPSDDFDREEVERMNAEPWQLVLLDLNPEYTLWGREEESADSEDKTEKDTFSAPLSFESWAKFQSSFDSVPDRLNEVVHFYFDVSRAAEECSSCDASGFSPKAYALDKAFYDHDGDGDGWCNKITLDEAQTLVENHRLSSFIGGQWQPPKVVDAAFVALVNKANSMGSRGAEYMNLQHDAINRHMLVRRRCERLGIAWKCSKCEGHGEVFTAAAAHVELGLWILHPGRDASRFVTIKLVKRADLPGIMQLLSAAAKHNAARFAKVVQAATN